MTDDDVTAPDESHVGRHTRRGISWNLAGAVSTNAMRLITVVVLGRILDAHEFGVVAAAVSVLAFLHAIRDIGIGPSLIQRRELEPGHVATAFATSTYLGLFIAGAIIAAAPLIGDLYEIPESVPLLRALGGIFALRGLATTSQMMVQRAMDFRAVAIIDTVSYSLGSATSMTLALAGLGAWSLVVGYLVEESTSTIAYLMHNPPRFTLRVEQSKLRDLLGFGAGATVSNIGVILATQGDNFVVGHTLGPEQLGFYTRAYDLIKLPSLVFTNIVGNVLFPAFARLQTDPARLKQGFRRVIFANALIVLPASAALVATAPEMIGILMGPHWSGAVLPFRILVVTMLMRVSYKVGAMVASAAGAVTAVAAVNLAYAVCVIGGAAITVRWGIPGVAVSTAISLTIVYLASSWLGMLQCGLGWGEFARAHAPGLAIAVVVGAGTWPLAEAMRTAGLPIAVTFATIAVVGAGATLVAMAIGVKRGRGDFVWLGEELARVRRKLTGRRS